MMMEGVVGRESRPPSQMTLRATCEARVRDAKTDGIRELRGDAEFINFAS